MGSSPYRGGGDRSGRRRPSLPPPRADQNPHEYELFQAVEKPPLARHGQDPPWAPAPPRAPHGYGPRRAGEMGRAGEMPGQMAAAPPAPGSGPPGRFGQHAPAPQEFGYAPGPGSWPAVDPDPRPLAEQEAFEPREAAARADVPAGPYAPRPAGPGESWGPQGAPEWPPSAGELPTAAGAGYPDAAEGTRLETLDNFPPPGKRRRKRLLATAAVVAVAVLAGIALFVTRHSSGNTGHAAGPAPTGSKATEAGAARSPGRAQAGPGSVSTALAFPHARVVADGIKFGRVTAVLNEQCARAARGAFATALKSAGCQRVARATFVDSAKRYAVTAGVAELPSPAAARLANRSANFGPDVWFTGLDGPAKAGAAAVSKSVGLGYETVYGRYIVYALATYGDGRNPTGHKAAVKALKDLAKSFTSLTRRPLIAPGK